MSIFAGQSIDELRAYGLEAGVVTKKKGFVIRVTLEDGGAVEVTFEKCFATVQGMKRVEPTGAEVREVIEVLSGLEVSNG